MNRDEIMDRHKSEYLKVGTVALVLRDMSRRRRMQQAKVAVNSGDSRMTSFLVTSGVISIVIIIFISMASDYRIGPAEGEIIPNIGGEVYENGEWTDFDLHSGLRY